MEYSWIITNEEKGAQLLSFIRGKLGSQSSAKEIKRSLTAHQCRVNGRIETHGTHLLLPGETVTFRLQQMTKQAFAIDSSRILFEDEDLFVYDKPPHITSEELNIRLPHLTLVHRLDKETTGVIIFGKNRESSQMMEQMFKERQVDKEYLALVDGVPKASQGVIDNEVGKINKQDDFAIWGPLPKEKGGVSAYTEWKVEKKGAHAALLRCYPKTGRTHQIRVHLSGIGHPILGDGRYGRDHQVCCHYVAPRILLHAQKLIFFHPTKKEKLEITSPLPKEISEAMEELLR